MDLNDSDDDFVNSFLFNASAKDLEIRPTWEDSSNNSAAQFGWNMVCNLPNPFKKRRIVQTIEVAEEEPDDLSAEPPQRKPLCSVM